MEEIKRFIDEYPPEAQFNAERVNFEDILDKELVVLDIANMTGKHGDYLVVLAKDKLRDMEIQFLTGSHVIIPKLKKAKEESKLPLIIKFIKQESEGGNRYYDIN